MLRPAGGAGHPGVAEQPGMFLQLTALGIDAAMELIIGAVKKDDDIFQLLALVGDA